MKQPKIKKTKCPVCNSQRVIEGPYGKICQKCGYRNDLKAAARMVTRK